MGTYDITYTSADGHERGQVDTAQLLDLHQQGQLVAVHGPAEIRRELDRDLDWERER